MIKKETLSKSALLAMIMFIGLAFSPTLFGQEKKLKNEEDGFEWYNISQNGICAAEKASGTILIPLSRGYDFICYHTTFGGGWFSVGKDGKYGACDKEGNEIIAPIKYDGVYYVQQYENHKFCYVKLNNKNGVCDKNGNEIIKPQYDNVVFHENGGYYGVELNGKEGVCDMKGNEIIHPKYKSVFYSSSDRVFKYEDGSGNYVSTGIALADDESNYKESSSEPKQVAQKKEKKQKKSFGEVMGIIADGLQVVSKALEGVNESLQPLAEQNNTYYNPQNNYNSSFENNSNYSNNDDYQQRREERDKKADQMEWERRHGSSYQRTYNNWYDIIIDVKCKSTKVKNWEPDYRLKQLRQAQSKCKEIANLYKEKAGHEIPCTKELLNWNPSAGDLVGQ